MEEFITYVKATICKLAGLTCIGTAVLAAMGEFSYALGWCIGSGINILYFVMLSSRSARALRLPPQQAVAFIRGGAVLRLLTVALVLGVLSQIPAVSIGAAAAGILSYRLVIAADALFQYLHNSQERR